jgi:putative exosortase-associated protein (TIGR04073 family)
MSVHAGFFNKGGQMRKLAVCAVIVFILSIVSVHAQEIDYIEAKTQKATHGFVNLFTGWLEIGAQASKGYQKGLGEEGKNNFLGGVLGVLRGICHGVGRTAAGILQLTTFALPNHKDNEGVGIPLDSEYAWEEGSQYCIMKDGAEPVGKKCVRGVIDATTGILEMPAQLGKAFTQNNFLGVMTGICKAITYPVARIVSGVYDVVTVLLPGDKKTHGYPFDEEKSWEGLGEITVEGPQWVPVEMPEPMELPVPDMYIMNMFAP